MNIDLPSQIDMGGTLHGKCIHAALFTFHMFIFKNLSIYTSTHTNTQTPTPTSHPHPHPHPHPHLIVDSVRCVYVWCPLQHTRLASPADLLQSCKVVSKRGTAVFTGGGRARTFLVCAQGANCTDRQTDRHLGSMHS